tara:strand:- start:331 stop:1017 length:687 start_codon:yes stop_codon:yes gene_type:complete
MVMTKQERIAAAKKAAHTRKKHVKLGIKPNNKKKVYSGKKKSEIKLKCVSCKKSHSITQFYGAQNIAVSEGITQEKLEKKYGNNSIVFNTGTATGLLDIGVYDNSKSKSRLEFYEIKPIDQSKADKQLLKPRQKEWVLKSMKFGIKSKIVFYKEKNFEFKHSEPIELKNKKMVEKYSQPLTDAKQKMLEKIKVKKQFSDKKLTQISEKYITGKHDVKYMKKIIRMLSK